MIGYPNGWPAWSVICGSSGMISIVKTLANGMPPVVMPVMVSATGPVGKSEGTMPFNRLLMGSNVSQGQYGTVKMFWG